MNLKHTHLNPKASQLFKISANIMILVNMATREKIGGIETVDGWVKVKVIL